MPMAGTTGILPFRQGDEVDDPVTALAREGARRLLAEALSAEADAFVAAFAKARLEDGRRRVVRHGHGPERALQTRVSPIPVRRPEVRDRGAGVVEAPSGTGRIASTQADPAAPGAPPRRAAARSLPARRLLARCLDGRLRRGAVGAARPRRPEPAGDQALRWMYGTPWSPPRLAGRRLWS